MKIVVLDGHALNPGDISWSPLNNTANSPSIRGPYLRKSA